MFRFIFIVSFIFTFISSEALAQELDTAPGAVEVIQDVRITQLADQYHKMSLNNLEIDGYRVQIFFDSGSNSKNKATKMMEEFGTAYPGIKTYLSYNEPYYRVRVGDFRIMSEAVGFQKKINADFPNSFPVKDKILP